MPLEVSHEDILTAALASFQEHGYEAVSVADIMDELGTADTAGGQHPEFKEQLLIQLVQPLLEDIEAVLDRFPRHPSWPDEGRRLLSSYLDVLIGHRGVVVWIDGDKAVLNHSAIGKRLAESNRRIRTAIRGDDRSTAARLGASAALGTMWRPLRNLTDIEVQPEKDAILAVALAVVETVRS